MSNYGISILIAILVTSFVAFYLLYRAKELNLGILVSISIGSTILGVTFHPMFERVFNLLTGRISINQQISMFITLIIILTVFLIFVLIVSAIISIIMPKKLASIDCCVIIDRLLLKMKSSEFFKYNRDKISGFYKMLIIKVRNMLHNVYSVQNMLKKPVDTSPIIDTMSIEQNIEKLDLSSIISINSEASEDNCEPVEIQMKIDFTVYDEIDKAIDVLAVENIDELERIDLSTYEIVIDEAAISAEEIEIIESILETEEVELEIIEEIDARSLLQKAFDSKNKDNKEEAIGYYYKALKYNTDSSVVFWIVLDICTLYKQLGLTELAKSILEGLVNQYGSIIKPDIKVAIMNNLN